MPSAAPANGRLVVPEPVAFPYDPTPRKAAAGGSHISLPALHSTLTARAAPVRLRRGEEQVPGGTARRSRASLRGKRVESW